MESLLGEAMLDSFTFWLIVLAVLIAYLCVSVGLRLRAEGERRRAIEEQFAGNAFNASLIAPWREFSAAYGGTLLAHRSAIGTPAYYGPQGRSRCQPVPPSILRGGVNGDPVQAGSPSY